MTTMEKAILQALADVTTHMTELGKLQISLANKVAQNLPNLPESEKSEILNVAESSWLQVQSLQDKATKLKSLL